VRISVAVETTALFPSVSKVTSIVLFPFASVTRLTAKASVAVPVSMNSIETDSSNTPWVEVALRSVNVRSLLPPALVIDAVPATASFWIAYVLAVALFSKLADAAVMVALTPVTSETPSIASRISVSELDAPRNST